MLVVGKPRLAEPVTRWWSLRRKRSHSTVVSRLEAVSMEEEEEEGLFKADAVNEEDPERDRATQV